MQARRSLALLIILTVFTFSIDPAGAAGRSASSIPNTILSGKGAPTLKVGINGDFYIDTRSLLIYGPKKNGKWSSPKNLQGPAGAAGANGNDGKSGSDGKNGSDGKSVAGVSTTAGPAGPATLSLQPHNMDRQKLQPRQLRQRESPQSAQTSEDAHPQSAHPCLTAA